jgi:hypothetical protein
MGEPLPQSAPWTGPRELEQLAQLDLRLDLGLAGLAEAELAAGQRVLPGVHLAGGCIAPPTSVHEWVHGPTRVAIKPRWGGWGSNPRPADYESAALTC